MSNESEENKANNKQINYFKALNQPIAMMLINYCQEM